MDNLIIFFSNTLIRLEKLSKILIIFTCSLIGGIKTGAINPDTLESYIVPGLYFAGEMLEVYGDLGGFNFQWAWASGMLAGKGLGS